MRLPKHKLEKRDGIMDMRKILALYENFTQIHI